jgi:hypothetical protein
MTKEQWIGTEKFAFIHSQSVCKYDKSHILPREHLVLMASSECEYSKHSPFTGLLSLKKKKKNTANGKSRAVNLRPYVRNAVRETTTSKYENMQIC